jgi:hypothetical protein
MQSDKKILLESAAAEKKRQLQMVGGYDNAMDVDMPGNSDASKRGCVGLAAGQQTLVKAPTQAEFREAWSEAMLKNALPLSLVDDPLFRKALVTTSLMGQAGICMGKGVMFGKRDTTLPHRHTFAQTIIPATERRLDEEAMTTLMVLSHPQ